MELIFPEAWSNRERVETSLFMSFSILVVLDDPATIWHQKSPALQQDTVHAPCCECRGVWVADTTPPGMHL